MCILVVFQKNALWNRIDTLRKEITVLYIRECSTVLVSLAW